MPLTPEQKARYARDGFLVFPQLFPRDVSGRLLERVDELLSGHAPLPGGVRVQIEPAIERTPPGEGGTDPAVRKIECLIEHDERFFALARDPRLLDPVTDLLGPDVKLFRDALMMKPAHHGSAKPYHQDSAYWAIDPPDLCSAWIALDPATTENGCMRVLPGSHKWGVLEHKQLADYQVEEERLDLRAEVSVPLEPGGVLLFHSLLLHATAPNTSQCPRRAMICSYMSARSRYTGPTGTHPQFLAISGASYEGCV
jgi:phytanoyl-CoA hydroxylase